MQARLEAVWKKDTTTWSRLTSDDFTVVIPEGYLVTKKERMSALRQEVPQPLHSIQREQIQSYDNTAIRRFIDQNEWILEIWAKQNGEWRDRNSQTFLQLSSCGVRAKTEIANM